MNGTLKVFVASMLAAAISAQAATASEPTTLQPSSKWVLDYANGYCRLARQFGTGDSATVFYLEQYEPGDHFTVLVAGRDFRPKGLRKPVLRFGPNGGSSDVLFASSLGKYGGGVSKSSMHLLPDSTQAAEEKISNVGGKGRREHLPGPPLIAAEANLITTLELTSGDRPVGRLALGSMGEPVRALNACIDDLTAHWGIDVAANRTRSRPPIPLTEPSAWVSADLYPTKAIREGIAGIVYFRLTVDEAGRTVDCEVQQVTDPPEFSTIVCNQMKKVARFSPALDASGRPLKSYWASSVRFQIQH